MVKCTHNVSYLIYNFENKISFKCQMNCQPNYLTAHGIFKRHVALSTHTKLSSCEMKIVCLIIITSARVKVQGERFTRPRAWITTRCAWILWGRITGRFLIFILKHFPGFFLKDSFLGIDLEEQKSKFRNYDTPVVISYGAPSVNCWHFYLFRHVYNGL